MKHYKHLFFDMDGTVTPSRSLIDEEMESLLDELPHDIVIVSGSSNEQMKKQIPNAKIHQLGQNGNHAISLDKTELWNFKLKQAHKEQIHKHIQQIVEFIDHELNEEWAPIEDRGGQITFSPIGNNAPTDLKKTYDPDRKKREEMLRNVPFESDDLLVKIGGSTSFDYIHKDGHKGANVAKLIDLMGWNYEECVYFGDGLFPGGNDEVVIGVIDTVSVESDQDTLQKLKERFS